MTLRQTARGIFPEFSNRSKSVPATRIFVFFMFYSRPLFSEPGAPELVLPSFQQLFLDHQHRITLTQTSTKFTLEILKPRSKEDGFRSEPWWTQTPTSNYLLVLTNYTTAAISIYGRCKRCVNESLYTYFSSSSFKKRKCTPKVTF